MIGLPLFTLKARALFVKCCAVSGSEDLRQTNLLIQGSFGFSLLFALGNSMVRGTANGWSSLLFARPIRSPGRAFPLEHRVVIGQQG